MRVEEGMRIGIGRNEEEMGILEVEARVEADDGNHHQTRKSQEGQETEEEMEEDEVVVTGEAQGRQGTQRVERPSPS